MEYWHVSLTAVRGAPAFAGTARCRAAVRCIDRVAGDKSLVFAVTAPRIELGLVCPGDAIGRACVALHRALEATAGMPIEPPHWRPVESRSHLMWLVRLVLGAEQALSSGSCFQDLVGARRLPSFAPRLFDALPRLQVRELCELAGVPAAALDPLSHEEVRRAGATRVARAAAASVAAPPALSGRDATTITALRAAFHLATDARIARAEIAFALGRSPRALRRLASAPRDADVLRAVRLQLALEDALLGRTLEASGPPPRYSANG